MAEFAKTTIRSLATELGVERMGDDAVVAIREAAKTYVIGLIKNSSSMSAHAKRKTLKGADVTAALQVVA